MTYEGSDYSGSQPGGIWQYLVSEDIFGCHKWQNVISLCWVEGRSAAKHPKLCKTISNSKEISDPKCQ